MTRFPTKAAIVLGAALALALGMPALATTGDRAGTTEPVTFTEVDLRIPATLPDDGGRPVTLDAVIDIPDAGCPCPGLLLNHGFLGDKGSEATIAHLAAGHGYVTLRYSSRGFGDTPGEVDLVGPKERQDMLDAVHWLNDRKNPLTGGRLRHDRIGQYGGSYGGLHAWALALANDPAVRTIAPAATATDLYQALAPNDVMLLAYANGFYASGFEPTGAVIGATGGAPDQVPGIPKLNYSQDLHRWVAEVNSGVNLEDAKAGLESRSVAGRFDDIHIPVFIIQGVNDGLFDLNQATAAYEALAARGVPVRLYAGGIGHPPSESSTNSPEALHIGDELLAWFDHWLKGEKNGITARPAVEFSRASYFDNHWDGTTRSAHTFPFGEPTALHLCNGPGGLTGGTLSATPCPNAPPAVAVNTYAGEGYGDEPLTGGAISDGATQLFGTKPDLARAPGTFVYEGAPVAAGMVFDLAGIPSVSLTVTALPRGEGGARGGAAAFQLDPKLWDVAPDGTAKLVTRGAYAEPLTGATGGALGTVVPVARTAAFDLNGCSYAIPAGHHLRLTLSTEDTPYLRPTPNPFAVSVLAGSTILLPSAAALHS